MPLPSSGTITLQQINTEFGGGNDHLLNFYRYPGGARVPNTAINVAIPASGTITIREFLGSSAVPVNIFSADFAQNSVFPQNAGISIQICANGVFQVQKAHGTSAITTNYPNQWISAGWLSDPYQVMATVVSEDSIFGSFTGTENVWLNCNTSPQWTTTSTARTADSVEHANVHIQIRSAATLTVLASVYFNMNCDTIGSG